MRILCDQNVPNKYIEAFKTSNNITAATVANVLQHDATDTEIVAYAEQNNWVVFTNDDDFFVVGGDHGLLLYDQVEDPLPGDVVTAVQRISEAYRSQTEIIESVPGNWIQ